MTGYHVHVHTWAFVCVDRGRSPETYANSASRDVAVIKVTKQQLYTFLCYVLSSNFRAKLIVKGRFSNGIVSTNRSIAITEDNHALTTYPIFIFPLPPPSFIAQYKTYKNQQRTSFFQLPRPSLSNMPPMILRSRFFISLVRMY